MNDHKLYGKNIYQTRSIFIKPCYEVYYIYVHAFKYTKSTL